MKTKILLLALVIMGTSFAYSQNTDQLTKTKSEMKVLKTIKRRMNLVNFTEYIPVGSKTNVELTYFLNEQNVIEVANIEGVNDNLKASIIDVLENNPVKCEDQPTGKEFSVLLTFKHISLGI